MEAGGQRGRASTSPARVVSHPPATLPSMDPKQYSTAAQLAALPEDASTWTDEHLAIFYGQRPGLPPTRGDARRAETRSAHRMARAGALDRARWRRR